MTDRVGCGLPFFKSILGGRKAMSRLKRLAVYSAFLLAMGSLGAGQKTVHAQTLDDKALKGMKWRQIGPFRGGRALAVAGVAGDPGTYYFGAVAGGVWKTENGGLTWMPMTDKTGIMSIGAMAVAPSDPNVVYVGTGESCIRGNISYGDGMRWKSTRLNSSHGYISYAVFCLKNKQDAHL